MVGRGLCDSRQNCGRWDDPQGRQWAEAFAPLEKGVESTGCVPTCRTSTGRSVPACIRIRPSPSLRSSTTLAWSATNKRKQLIIQRSRDFYLGDRDYAVAVRTVRRGFFFQAD